MALIKCGECGKEISDEALVCPHCGIPTMKKKGSGNKRIGIIILIVFCVLFFITKSVDILLVGALITAALSILGNRKQKD